MKHISLLVMLSAALIAGCGQLSTQEQEKASATAPFSWNNATIYFALTDRFSNGDPSNDFSFDRKQDGAVLRNFSGGDLRGVINKIEEGYFDRLGVNAIWLTPQVEQVRGHTDEGTGKTYAYHGYWASDFTSVDPNLGTMDDMKEFVETAHKHGIRVLLDVVINHTGPPTEIDAKWPSDWVRMTPTCAHKDAKTSISCTLVENLPDILTESDANVDLPPTLAAKWKKEGRLDQELAELDDFFASTGFPRAPRYYIMKWHLDWVKELGIDGFRVDTAKHTEAEIWAELKTLAIDAHAEWKQNNPNKAIGNDKFYMTAEVYGYGIQAGRWFNMGGENEQVDFFANGFDSLINFSMKGDANKDYEQLFSEYDALLNSDALKDRSIVSYVTSHDDSGPFDKTRERPFESATKLLLSPGAVQVYYGDETARGLIVEGTTGDATLRSFMNWDELSNNTAKNGYNVGDVYTHWSKLGKFRQQHISVGAGRHQQLESSPYVFKRSYNKDGVNDSVVVALGLEKSQRQSIPVHGVFSDGEWVKDYYSGTSVQIANGVAIVNTTSDIVLLGKPLD